jgi:hypothetical protein
VAALELSAMTMALSVFEASARFSLVVACEPLPQPLKPQRASTSGGATTREVTGHVPRSSRGLDGSGGTGGLRRDGRRCRQGGVVGGKESLDVLVIQRDEGQGYMAQNRLSGIQINQHLLYNPPVR